MGNEENDSLIQKSTDDDRMEFGFDYLLKSEDGNSNQQLSIQATTHERVQKFCSASELMLQGIFILHSIFFKSPFFSHQ